MEYTVTVEFYFDAINTFDAEMQFVDNVEVPMAIDMAIVGIEPTKFPEVHTLSE